MNSNGKKLKRALSFLLTSVIIISSLITSSTAADTNIAPLATASTSFCSSWESITALNDGYNPTSSSDRSHSVYGNWDNPGTTQWVQYDFTQSYTISKSDVYWFDDNQGIDLPASCAIKYWNGSAWVNVSNPSGLGVLGNQYNTTTFTPVTTTRIRLEITAKPSYSTGILEWRVWGSEESTPPPEMAAHYKFDETSGTQASDSSGNGKTATLTGATWTSGRSGNAVNLSGSNQYVSLPSGIVSGLNDFTVATWVKLDTRSNWSRIFDFGTGTSYYMFLTPSSSGNTVRFAIKNGGTEQVINSTSALPTGAWKHVAVTLSGNTGRLYIDGVLAGTNSSMTIKPSNLGTTNLNYIGRSMYSSDPYLDGLVDDFRIFGRALSASEIGTLYGVEPPTDIVKINNATTGTGLNQVEYVGSWSSASNSSAHNGDEHWAMNANDYLQIRFYGRQIKIYGSKDTDYGTFCPSIDGGSESSWSSWQVVRRNKAILYESRVLPLGNHTIKIRVAGLKNPDTPNTNTKFYFDYADVYSTGTEPTSPAHGDTPVITSPPSWCDPFYTKCVMVQDIPIVSSNNVANSSLIKAFNIINPMLTKIMADKPAVYQKMLDNSVKITIVGLNEYNMDLPEWSWQPSCNFNATFRGSNGGRETLIIEEDIIASTQWLSTYCVPCHEFAHTILSFGFGDIEYPGAEPSTTQAIINAYNSAVAANKYTESSYDRSNIHEYFAGNTGRWFNANPMNLNVPNASSKTARQQLQEYDIAIYNVLASTFSSTETLPSPWN